jgi:hypothetical protein
VSRHSYDKFWAENQPAFHAYDYGANIHIESNDRLPSLPKETPRRLDKDDENDDDSEETEKNDEGRENEEREEYKEAEESNASEESNIGDGGVGSVGTLLLHGLAVGAGAIGPWAAGDDGEAATRWVAFSGSEDAVSGADERATSPVPLASTAGG